MLTAPARDPGTDFESALIGPGQGRYPGIPILSTGAMAQALKHQPAGATEQGDQTPHPRRRDLPQRRRHHPPGWALLLEQQEEWHLEGRRVFSELSMA